MNTYDICTFVCCLIIVFIMFSCVYQRHIRRGGLFRLAVIVFLCGMIIPSLWQFTSNLIGIGSAAGTFAAAAMMTPPSNLDTFLYNLGTWIVYGSVLLFFLACRGNVTAFPQCSVCGYNLSGNSSGKCPECGSDLSGPTGSPCCTSKNDDE